MIAYIREEMGFGREILKFLRIIDLEMFSRLRYEVLRLTFWGMAGIDPRNWFGC